MKEEWRPIIGYEGIYEVSSFGRVKRIAPGKRTWPGRIFIGRTNGRQLHRQVLLGGRKNPSQPYIHRLVMEAFIGPCPSGHEVNHKDCDPENNLLENLEYVTHTENVRHAGRNGLLNRGREVYSAKLWPSTVKKIRRLYESGLSTRTIARTIGIGKSTVHQIVTRKYWAHVA